MSDAPTNTRTPSSVERMSSTNTKAAAGMGGMMTALLAVACLALIVACFYIASGKRDLQAQLDQTKTKLSDAEAAVTAKDNTISAKDRDIASLRTELDKRIPLFRLPAAVQAPNVNDALANIQRLADAGPSVAKTDPSKPNSVTPPAADTPAAWVETIARQVAKGSIKTSEPTGNDAAKTQMHKGIQIVMAKIGAFNKAPTGNNKDTYEAVVAFQKANGLTPDGVIGKGTWGKVRERLEAPAHVNQ